MLHYARTVLSLMFTLVVLIFSLFPFSIATAAVPDAPTIGPAWSVRNGATVTFSAPASDGGSPITGYTVTSDPPGGVDSNAGTTETIHVITGLTNGTSYEFSVTADNIDGTGAPSGASNPVTARPYSPLTGTINNVVIFIRFSDQPEFTKLFSYYDGLFNSDNESLKNFYLENSYNTLMVNSTFYPLPSDDTVVSYQDPNPTTYYQPYDADTNPGGYQGAEVYTRETALVTNALTSVSADIAAAGLNLDGDNDGYLDHITFEVYSSVANPLPALFYSRATFDSSGVIAINGKQAGSYTWVTSPQDTAVSYLAATEIHEMGHSLGYPDLRQNAGGRYPVGNYDVMSTGVPVHFGVYLKNKFTNWISDIPEITASGTYTINDITQATDNSYKISIPGSSEFLVLEYRKAAGDFESNLPWGGLCITRVNEAEGIWGNLDGPPYFLYYYRPDGTIDSDSPDANLFECLSAESGLTQFNDSSNPACFLSDGSPCGIFIDNIGPASGLSTTFSFITVPGAPTAVSASAGSTQATVTFTAPVSNGGSAITGYSVTSSPAGGTDSNAGTTGTSHTITGLTNGTEYTFTVTASNSVGTSSASTASDPVTPKLSQTISFGALAGKTFGAAPFTVSATGGASGNPVTFSSTTPAVCTTGGTNGSTVTIAGAGTCTIAADQAGNATYSAAAQVIRSFTVAKASQTIGTISFSPATITLGGTTTASATATSGLALTFTSTTPTKCTISDSTVTAIAAGTCTIAANQAGNANYNAATQKTQNITVSKAAQTIGTVSFSPETLTAGGTTTVSATATSGLTVTFTSTTTAICTISGSVVTGKAVGTCTIAASQAGNANYNAANQVTQSITVGRGTQDIGTISISPLTLAVSGTTTVSATATSGLTVTFTSTTTGVCTISNRTITGVSAGSCIIAADQAGNANYFAATQETQSFTVAQASQTITFGALSGKTYGTAPFTVSATGGASGNQVSFSSTTPEICTAGGTNGKTITIIAAGTCSIAADQAGTANYAAAAQVIRSFTVAKASQTIVIGAVAGKTFGNAPFTVSATGGASGNPVTFSSATPAICTADGTNGNTITIAAAGACTIRANQAFSDNYAAAVQVSKNFTVAKASQAIVFETQGAKTYGDAPFTVSATGGASGNPVSFSSTTPLVCSASGTSGTVTIIGGGTCTIAANQATSVSYSAAPQVTQNITIAKKGQSIGTISFTPALIAVGGKITVSAAATTGLPVTFSSTTPKVCTLSGIMVTGVTAGTCTIAVNQAGNSNYAAAPQATRDITVDKGNQTIGAIGFTGPLKVEGKTTVSAKATTGLAVTFTSTTTEVCTVSGSTVTGVTAGTCKIAADQPGNDNYNAAPQVTQVVTVGKGTQTIGTISFSPATVTMGKATTLSAAATSKLDVYFASSTTDICKVSGNIVTGVRVGTCTIVANNPGDSNYSAATPVKQNLTIGKGSQTIEGITFSPAVLTAGGKTTVSSTATSGLDVTFTSTTTAICTISGNTVTGITAGSCIIAANQAGSTDYTAAAQLTQSIIVGQAPQAIVFGIFKQLTFGEATFTATATGGASGNPVTFSSTTPGVCTTGGTNGSTVTIVATGTCTIAAEQAGNASYTAAPQLTQSIIIGQASQVINFGALANQEYGAAPFKVSATGGSSGNPVTFTSITTDVCSTGGTNGNTVTIRTSGTCTIAAKQAGNSNYAAAEQVTQSFTVGQGSQAINFGSLSGKTFGAKPFKVNASGGRSGNPVTFSSLTTGICTTGGKNGSMVTIAAAGTCTIAADQAGNINYTAAMQVTQDFTVTQVSQSIIFKTQGKKTVGAASFTVIANGGRSGNPVTFSSTTPEVCTTGGTNGSTITVVAAGTCTIAADQAGDASYTAAAQVTQNITINKINQAIKSVTFNPSNIEIGDTATVSATATSGLEITFTSTTDVCTINGSTVTGVKVGKCTIAANQPGNAAYSAAAQVIRTISVGRESQSIETIGFSPANLEVDGTTTVSAKATSGLPVTFTSATTGVCKLSGTTVTGLRAGTCTIAASQAGNAGFNAAPKATQSITVGKGNQSIGAISLSAETITISEKTTVTAESASGLAVTFTSATPEICTVKGRQVTGITTGTCIIAADQPGNANYNPAAQVTQSFTVGQASQEIRFGALKDKLYGALPFIVRAKGGRSGNPITFSSLTSEVCTAGGTNGSTITIVSAGTCTIAANQAGNTNYSDALQVLGSINIGKGRQRIGAIRFSPTSLTAEGTTTVSATATSGLEVTFTSTTEDICTVNGNQVTAVKAGKCKIAANQAGDANYNAAAQVIKNITVGKGSRPTDSTAQLLP